MNLPKIELTVNGIKYDNTFDEDIKIDRTNLEEEFLTQSEKYAFYSFLAEEARYLADRRKAVVENVYAALDAEKRLAAAQMAAQNSKYKYTESMCHNEIIGDQRYKDVLEAQHKATLLANQLNVASRAMAMRKDMLMQMGHSQRAGGAPPRVQATQTEHVKDIITRKKENE